MRNKLQVAVEYLENQLELVRRYAEGYPDKDNYTALADIYTTALDTTLSTLRDALQRQPDPTTGLVPCGCGGVAEELFDGFSFDGDGMECNDYLVKCKKCGMQTQVIQTWSEKARDIWNTAMGWKGGAE